MQGRLTRILVEAEPGQRGGRARGARRRSPPRTTSTSPPRRREARLLQQALGPSDQATGFFAAISALLGFLLAFNAMLLTAPERRRMLAELRIQGFKPRQLVGLLLFQALVLGTCRLGRRACSSAACSRAALFSASPDYLAPAFTLGTSTVVGWRAGRARARRRHRSRAAWPPRRRCSTCAAGGRSTRSSTPAACRATRSSCATRRACCWRSRALLRRRSRRPCCWRAPSAALLACAMLALATVLAIPATFAAVVRLAEALTARFQRLNMLSVALLGAARDDGALARARGDRARSPSSAASRSAARATTCCAGSTATRRLRRHGRPVGRQPRSTTRRRTTSPARGTARARAAPSPGVAAVRAYQRRLPRRRRPPRVGDRAPGGGPRDAAGEPARARRPRDGHGAPARAAAGSCCRTARARRGTSAPGDAVDAADADRRRALPRRGDDDEPRLGRRAP